MAVRTSGDITRTLYKASQGYIDSNAEATLAQENITVRPSTFSDRIFTLPIPDNAPTDLVTDTSYTAGRGARQYSSTYPWIVQYTNVPLNIYGDPSNNLFTGPTDVVGGASAGYRPPTLGTNILTNVLLPKPASTTTTPYRIIIRNNNSGGTVLTDDMFILNRDAGTIKFYPSTSIIIATPVATFWRYEGQLLSDNKLYVGVPPSTNFQTYPDKGMYISDNNGGANLFMEDTSNNGSLFRITTTKHPGLGANMIQSGTGLGRYDGYPISIGRAQNANSITTIVDVSEQKLLVGTLALPRTANSVDGRLSVIAPLDNSSNIITLVNPLPAQVTIQSLADISGKEYTQLKLGNYYTKGNGISSVIQSTAIYADIPGGPLKDHGQQLLLNPLGGSVGVGGTLSIINSGNVGIGTTTPATKLDVNGATTLRGATTITTGGLDVNGTTTLRGATTITTGGLDVNGTTTLRGATTITTGGLDVSGNCKVTGYFNQMSTALRGLPSSNRTTSQQTLSLFAELPSADSFYDISFIHITTKDYILCNYDNGKYIMLPPFFGVGWYEIDYANNWDAPNHRSGSSLIYVQQKASDTSGNNPESWRMRRCRASGEGAEIWPSAYVGINGGTGGNDNRYSIGFVVGNLVLGSTYYFCIRWTSI